MFKFIIKFTNWILQIKTGKPDEQLNPKKKIWETIAPYLKTNSNCVATFKGDPFMVPGKGVIKSPSLANFQIK